MILYVARHAWAGNFGDPGCSDDTLRELTPDGIERYFRTVDALVEQRGFTPDRLATSPYTRCVQTATIIAERTPKAPEFDKIEALGCGVDLPQLMAWTAEHESAGDLCWVGHNPDVEALVAWLVGSPVGVVSFAKGSVAAVEFAAGPVEKGAGELLWHCTAKSLGV
ncbi:Histidine phosphatase superfamily (branch 1) [Pseudobythopirellula maris]|uniref:Histidine phosphatase superfamily (Branch 1) n=1 Tax=Pseudobythopirellula maris TaxID=2527991 RepID=A0A5C5ZNZ2_9BACT|nr:histidine phosphatase family protein [Pseudobythopirellula maris]TWT88153.1 Histidine phosphatase superfamily (branch 1) [Pseudobythopirellula maris]